jgi:hypothetical protein
LLAACGFELKQIKTLTEEISDADADDTEWKEVFTKLKDTTPMHTWAPMLAALYTAEIEEATQRTTDLYHNKINRNDINESNPDRHFTDGKVSLAHAETEELSPLKTDQHGSDARAFNLTEKVINGWTTLPLPTMETWINATNQDPDLKLLKTALETNTTPSRALFTDNKCHTELTSQRLILEEGVLYQLEQPKATRIRKLQQKIVPRTLRATVLAEHHATPLAGHTGACKTYWRIAARFWWPNMSKDVRKAVLECAHCREANTASHQAQQILGALSMDEPFDIISMDMWCRGKTQTNTTTMKNQKAALTSLCNLTGFASLAFAPQVDSDAMARLAFSHFFAPNLLPKLAIIDGGSEFKGVLVTMCEGIGTLHYVASPEAHNSIFCERFHRCLNTVQRIGAADAQSYEKWAMNSLFATCAWNGSPADGTDVIRSFAAKARTFHFPLDVQNSNEIAHVPQQGEATSQHVETMFPLWFRQKELLQLLNEERRTHHREMANQNKTWHHQKHTIPSFASASIDV